MPPSDWQAQHLHGNQNQATVEDWKTALDATVLKQGVFTMVFHPYDWIRNTQVLELVEHAFQKHQGKVKFLNFREANRRKENCRFRLKQAWKWDGSTASQASGNSPMAVILCDLFQSSPMNTTEAQMHGSLCPIALRALVTTKD